METQKHSVQPKHARYSSRQVGIHILPASFFPSPILGPSLAHSRYSLNVHPKLAWVLCSNETVRIGEHSVTLPSSLVVSASYGNGIFKRAFRGFCPFDFVWLPFWTLPRGLNLSCFLLCNLLPWRTHLFLFYLMPCSLHVLHRELSYQQPIWAKPHLSQPRLPVSLALW